MLYKNVLIKAYCNRLGPKCTRLRTGPAHVIAKFSLATCYISYREKPTLLSSLSFYFCSIGQMHTC
jgi:hypothetical protein